MHSHQAQYWFEFVWCWFDWNDFSVQFNNNADVLCFFPMIWSRTRRTTLVTNRANARTWMLTGCNSNKCSSTRTDQNTQRSLCVCVILRRKQAGRQYATRARRRWAGSLSPFALNAGGVRRLKRSRTHAPITTEQNFTVHYKYLSFVCVFRRTTPWWLSDAFVLIWKFLLFVLFDVTSDRRRCRIEVNWICWVSVYILCVDGWRERSGGSIV